MKKYIKPVFVAESYTFNEGFAATDCTAHVGGSESPDMMVIQGNKSACPVGDGGHITGEGNISSKAFPINLFNDGIGITDPEIGCDYDWNGRTGSVTGPDKTDYGTWQKAMWKSANPGNDNHRPGYDGKVFLS